MRHLAWTRIGALGALALLSACRGATLPPGSTDPITIGVVLSLCMGDDTDSVGYREAIELAVREANAAGGPLPGRRVEVAVGDSCYDPEAATREAQRLIDAGAVAILGDGGSSTTLAIAMDVASVEHVPLVSCSATSVLLTEFNARSTTMAGRFFARTAPPDDRQAEVLADIVRTEAACTRLGILHSDDEYGQPLARDITAALAGSGTTVVATVGYGFGSASYLPEVMEIADASPDCVALIAYPVEAGIMLRNWESLAGAPDVRWIGGDALRSSDFLGEAGSAARIDGFLGSAAITDLAAPEYQTFRDRLRAAYARPPTFEPVSYTANCYDAASLVLLAIADAGTTEGEAIRDALFRVAGPSGGTIVRPDGLANGFRLLRDGTAIDYLGASGSVDLDPLGDVPTSDYEVWRFEAATEAFARVRMIPAGTTL